MARQWGKLGSWHIAKSVNVLSGLHVAYCGRVLQGELQPVPAPGAPTCESCWRNEKKVTHA